MEPEVVRIEERARFARLETAATGGVPGRRPGYFFEPAVLAGAQADSSIATQEIFGPIAPITTFTHEEQAVAMANATKLGLASCIFTQNVDRAFRVAKSLQVGMVAINQGAVSDVAAPFGGTEHSGFGREGGPQGLE